MLVTWKPSEANKNNSEERKSKLISKKLVREKPRSSHNKEELKSQKKIGDLFGTYHPIKHKRILIDCNFHKL